jgi:hypothetical protein
MRWAQSWLLSNCPLLALSKARTLVGDCFVAHGIKPFASRNDISFILLFLQCEGHRNQWRCVVATKDHFQITQPLSPFELNFILA